MSAQEIKGLLVDFTYAVHNGDSPQAEKTIASIVTAIDAQQAEIDRLRAECIQARASADHGVRILSGIYALLYPPRITDSEGKTWEFQTPSAPHKWLQELSDRIRAIPDELQKATP